MIVWVCVGKLDIVSTDWFQKAGILRYFREFHQTGPSVMSETKDRQKLIHCVISL